MTIDEWSANGQSDSNLGRKGQAVADTGINRLTRWLTSSVSHLFFYYYNSLFEKIFLVYLKTIDI